MTLVMLGVFPLPHPLHTNLVMVLAGTLAPLSGALAVRKVPDTRVIKVVLAVGFVLTIAALLGFGGLLDSDMSGLRWRLYALFLMGSIATLCSVVRARLQ